VEVAGQLLRTQHSPFVFSSQVGRLLPDTMPGALITFEGGEGCGKSTQLARLAARLRADGRKVLEVSEPGSTAIGLQIRNLLLHAKEGRELDPRAELLLFAASRAQLVQQAIKPALGLGTVVLSDRFTDSTIVYQGVARGLDLAFIESLNDFATGGVRPDLTFLFDLDLPISQARLLRRVRPVGSVKDRIESLAPAFFEKVREGYLQLACKEPERFCVIDAGRRPDEIEAQIWEITDGFLCRRSA
jgi:dTMP kinase